VTDCATTEVTRLLRSDPEKLEAVLPVVLDSLRAMAHRQLRGERQDHTLGTTALVHEAYLKLQGYGPIEWTSRAHFSGIAARAMRQILVSYARRHTAEKRGGGAIRADLAPDDLGEDPSEEWTRIVALDQALTRLQAHSERAARVVECRYFAGLTAEETAEALGVSPVTVARDWRTARAWLRTALTS